LSATAIRFCACVLASLALPTGCSTPPEPEGQRQDTIPEVRPPAPPAPRQTVRTTTTWNFDTGSDECVAVATAGATSIRIIVQRHVPIRLLLSLAAPPGRRAPIPLRFSGQTGSWQASLQPSGTRQLTADLGSDETALSRVLVLLGGGLLDAGPAELPVVSLTIAPSATRGQQWFDCAREKLI
jgi:hypothetical protein